MQYTLTMKTDYEIIKDLINIYSDKYGKSIISETLANPENRPKIFYRYVNAENAGKFIIDSYPWLTHPKYYTDKYDGKWYDILDSPDYSEEEREILEGFRNYFKNNDNNIPRSTFKLASFTTNPLDKYMWENYAGHSSGICLEYDSDWDDWRFGEGNSLYDYLYPMIYTDEMINLSDYILNSCKTDDFPTMYCGFLTSILKNSEYSPENEWRAIVPESCLGNPDVAETFFAAEDITAEELERISNTERKKIEQKVASGEFVMGCPFLSLTLPKKIYLGENISEELKQKFFEFAKKKNCSLSRVVTLDGELIVEDLYESPYNKRFAENRAIHTSS